MNFLGKIALTIVFSLTFITTSVFGEVPNKIVFKGWNSFSTQFVNPPSYKWNSVPGAVKYRIGIAGVSQRKAAWYETTKPEFDFTSIWSTIPFGRIDMMIFALDKDEKHLEYTNNCHLFAYTYGWFTRDGNNNAPKSFFKVPGWNGGQQKPMDWDKVIEQNVRYLLLPRQDHKRDYEKQDDPRFLYSATESQAGQRWNITYPSRNVTLFNCLYQFAADYPNHELVEEAKRQGEIYGKWLLENNLPNDYLYSQFPFSTLVDGVTDESYGGGQEGKTISLDKAGEIGSGMIAMYNTTGDERYLNYAKKLADVLVKNQRADGSWPGRVNPKTGIIPKTNDYSISAVRLGSFIAEMERIDQKQEYTNARKKALQWVLDNPVKTNRWESVYEDVGTNKQAYSNLSQMDATFTIRFLLNFKNEVPNSVKIAEKINEFIEDQFVIWSNQAHSNYVQCHTPLVMEQYVCYWPMDGHTANWILSLAALYDATGNDEYLKKAVAAMNAISKTMYNNGELSTTWTWATDQRFDAPLLGNDHWACGSAMAARYMMWFKEYYYSVKAGKPKLFDLLIF